MSKHSVVIASDGSVRVDHHNADALQGLMDAGGANALGAGTLVDLTPDNLANQLQQVPEMNPVHRAAEQETHRRVQQQIAEQQKAYAKLQTATKIAAALIQKGQTRRRDPNYIADKSTAVAEALHARHPDAHNQVTWQEINDAVLAEMNNDASIHDPV